MVMLHLAEEFVRRGYQVDLLLLEERTERTAPLGVETIFVGSRARHGLSNMMRYMRRARPDIVISARDYINVLTLAAMRMARLRTGLIWTFHTHRGSQLVGVPKRLDVMADRLTRLFIRAPDRLVAVSAGVAEDIGRAFKLPAGKVEVIENPVWSQARLAAAEGLPPHPWFRSGPVVLAAGRLVAQKDFTTLISAFGHLPQTHRLIILGEGEERANLQTQIAAAGLTDRVSMPGYVVDPLVWMKHASVFVLSSRWEGFPLALVEALGCGTPIVATDCPSGPSEILAGGLGALVPVGDAGALHQAISATLANPGDPAPRRAAALRFDAQRAADLYLKAARHG